MKTSLVRPAGLEPATRCLEAIRARAAHRWGRADLVLSAERPPAHTRLSVPRQATRTPAARAGVPPSRWARRVATRQASQGLWPLPADYVPVCHTGTGIAVAYRSAISVPSSHGWARAEVDRQSVNGPDRLAIVIRTRFTWSICGSGRWLQGASGEARDRNLVVNGAASAPSRWR